MEQAVKKILLTGLVGEKAKHDGLAELHRKNLSRLKLYADRWGFELVDFDGYTDKQNGYQSPGRHKGSSVWIKLGFHQIVSHEHHLHNGDCVVWIDSDSVLVRGDYDLTPRKDFVFSREPRGTLNAGVMGWRVGDFSNRLISSTWNMLDEDILPGLPADWVDQSAIITFLSRLSRWERFRHVGYYPPYVNCTGKCELMPEAIYRKMVIRHFAGNLPIEWAWFNHPVRGIK